MRASTAARGEGPCSITASPLWGDPHGPAGLLALAAMAIANRRLNAAALDLLAPRAGEAVLEIGCGPGMGLRAAAKRVGRSGFVAAVDHCATAVHAASHAAHGAILRGSAAVLRAKASDLPFRDAMFDRAFAVNSFQFWPDPARALREIARVLAPRGRLVLTQRAARDGQDTGFPSAREGMERVGQAAALFKAQGWRMIDERVDADGAHLAASILAERPD